MTWLKRQKAPYLPVVKERIESFDVLNGTVETSFSGTNSSGISLCGIARVRNQFKAGPTETRAECRFREIPIKDRHSYTFPRNKCGVMNIFVRDGVERQSLRFERPKRFLFPH